MIGINVIMKDWMVLIDYALMRIYLQSKIFKTLFTFLTSNKIFLDSKKLNYFQLIKTLETQNVNQKKKYILPIIIEFYYLLE